MVASLPRVPRGMDQAKCFKDWETNRRIGCFSALSGLFPAHEEPDSRFLLVQISPARKQRNVSGFGAQPLLLSEQND